jgi:hypothetical protein
VIQHRLEVADVFRQYEQEFLAAWGYKFSPLEAIAAEHFDKIFDVNVKGLLFTVQKALTLFPDKGGSIRPSEKRRKFGPCSRPVRPTDQAMTIEYGVDGAAGRDLDGVRQSSFR